MTSVERIVEYAELPPEAALTSPNHSLQLRDWPSRGAIRAEDVELKYSADGPAVLSNLNFVIIAGEKVCGQRYVYV